MEEIQYAVRDPKTMAEMASAELAKVLKETDVPLVPMGSTEQHGPHLPLSCDKLVPEELCGRIVKKLAADGITVVACPVIPFGLASMNMHSPGTIALKAGTFKTVIK